jgi:hypothetical protein
MSNSKEEDRKRLANKSFKAEQLQRDSDQRVRERQAHETAVSQKIARLRSLRLAQEAANAEAPAEAPKKPARQARR